jgi:exodeoxyribonuclease V alpha subunit
MLEKDQQYDETQLEAINKCCNTDLRLVSVSGPAGSGKTTILRRAFHTLKQQGRYCVLAAPTGKAARRIKEATGIDAVTIHKLLEYNKPGEIDEATGKALQETAPKRNRMNRLDYDMVFIDEYAMVPTELHNNIMAALPSAGCVRAFGDIHQLPPIENKDTIQGVIDSRTQKVDAYISPFKKLLRDHPSVELTKVYRQGDGSAILEAANKIRQGHRPPMNQDAGSEFMIKLSNTPITTLRQWLTEWDAREGGPPADFREIKNQVISAQRKGEAGTYKINNMMQKVLNPNPKYRIDLMRPKWLEKLPVRAGIGDKVVCIENTYDLRDYFDRFESFADDGVTPEPGSYIQCPENKQMLNGEVGIITEIHPDGGLEIDFGDRIVELPAAYEDMNTHTSRLYTVYPQMRLELAYALTTHKCQGSEFDTVIYLLNARNTYMQNRKNYYTAVTRASKRAIVLSDQKSLVHSVTKRGE